MGSICSLHTRYTIDMYGYIHLHGVLRRYEYIPMYGMGMDSLTSQDVSEYSIRWQWNRGGHDTYRIYSVENIKGWIYDNLRCTCRKKTVE